MRVWVRQLAGLKVGVACSGDGLLLCCRFCNPVPRHLTVQKTPPPNQSNLLTCLHP